MAKAHRTLARDGIVAALDIGSTKVCCFIGNVDDLGIIRVAGIGHQASKGIKAGAVVDMEAAEQAVLSAVHAAEQMADVTIRSVYVNVNSGHPSSNSYYFEHPLRGGAIDDGDVRRLLH